MSSLFWEDLNEDLEDPALGDEYVRVSTQIARTNRRAEAQRALNRVVFRDQTEEAWDNLQADQPLPSPCV